MDKKKFYTEEEVLSGLDKLDVVYDSIEKKRSRRMRFLLRLASIIEAKYGRSSFPRINVKQDDDSLRVLVTIDGHTVIDFSNPYDDLENFLVHLEQHLAGEE